MVRCLTLLSLSETPPDLSASLSISGIFLVLSRETGEKPLSFFFVVGVFLGIIGPKMNETCSRWIIQEDDVNSGAEMRATHYESVAVCQNTNHTTHRCCIYKQAQTDLS